jgi:hypothetical protein
LHPVAAVSCKFYDHITEYFLFVVHRFIYCVAKLVI